jgi:quinol monooxygenase YgiN
MTATPAADPSTQPVLVVSFRARPDTAAELRGRLEELARLTTTQEPGCIQYELHTDDEDPLHFMFVETWASDAALALHDQTPYVKAIQADAPRLNDGPVVLHRLRKLC